MDLKELIFLKCLIDGVREQ